MTEIVEVKDFIPAYTDAVQKLLEQLTNRPVKLPGQPSERSYPKKTPICFSYWLIRKLREC